MNKVPLIIKREYLTRVKKRSFILATILTPIGIALFYLLIGLMVTYETDESFQVAVVDTDNIIAEFKQDTIGQTVLFDTNNDLATLKTNIEAMGYDGILEVSGLQDAYQEKLTVFYHSDDDMGIEMQERVRDWVGDQIETYKMDALELDGDKLAALKTRVSIDPQPIDENTKDDSSTMSSVIGVALGTIMGMVMMLIITLYGTMVMRGVMEEKVNRISEIIVSSVRPFELMLGKIVGIGLVCLTQIGVWIILIPVISLIVSLAIGIDTTATLPSAGEIPDEMAMDMMQQVLLELQTQNWALIIPSFIIFFLGGFFIYASLFAAVGSAIGDDAGESQSLTLPIMIPVMLAFYITAFVVIRAPDSSLSVWASIFPLFSPIVMPARLAFDPPLWQVALSIILLIGTAIFFVWLSGRIYRVGILLYGKKTNWKEIIKWTFYKS